MRSHLASDNSGNRFKHLPLLYRNPTTRAGYSAWASNQFFGFSVTWQSQKLLLTCPLLCKVIGSPGFIPASVIGRLIIRLASATNVVHPSTQEVSSGSPGLRVSVSNGKITSSEQISQFFRVNFIVFLLTTVDGFEVQGVAQNKGELFAFTPVTQPVPVEGTFAANDKVFRKGSQLFR